MAPKRRKSTTKRKAKPVTRYIVKATFRMETPPITKAEADKWAAKVRRKNGTCTISKV